MKYGSCFLDLNNKPGSYGKLYFYDKEINEMKPVFEDYERTITHLSPVQLGRDGECPEIFLEGTHYRVELRDSRDQIIWIHEMKDEVRVLGEEDICEMKSCDEKATHMVYSRMLRQVLLCCEHHADIVVEEQCPEYTDVCENCGCMLPVN